MQNNDYDIFQNFHSFILRHYLTNLSNDNDNDNDSIFVSFTSCISSFISYFTTYHFSFERSFSQTSFFEKMMQHEKQK